MATEILVRVYLDGSGDYTNVRAAVIAEAVDLVAADSYIVFELKGDLRNTDSFVDFNSYTTDATRNVIIRPIAADYADGIAGNTGTIYGVNTFLVVARDKHVTIDGLDFDGWTADVFGPANTIITNCLMYDATAGVLSIASITNTILYNLPNQALRSVTGGVTRVTAVNKDSATPATLLLFRTINAPITNSVAHNDVVGADNYTLSTNVANDFNASNDGTAPGTNTQTVATTDFEDYANNNFNIKSTSPLFALNVGADLVPSGSGISVTGTAVPTQTEANIVSGGKTIILTLSGDTFVAAGTGPIGSTADTQAIIDGLDSAQVEATGWNAEVRDKEVTTAVVRTSSTVATITLTASAAYDITATETITATIPNAVLVTGTSDIIATPTFTVTPIVSGFQAAWAVNSNIMIQ